MNQKFFKLILIFILSYSIQKNIEHLLIGIDSIMNFHNNAAFTKILHTLHDYPSSSKESKEIYQSVLFKHFQIIQTFLQKINSLYNKHQEFQTYLSNINEKIEKLESNTKNIHHQFRTTHLMIDKRLNTIGADFHVLNEKMHTRKKENNIDQYLNSNHFMAQSSQLKSRRSKQMNYLEVQNKKNGEKNDFFGKMGSDNIIVSQTQLIEPICQKQKQELQHKQRKMKELGFKVDSGVKTCEKLSKIVESDCISSKSSIGGGPSIMINQSYNNVSRQDTGQKNLQFLNEVRHESFKSINQMNHHFDQAVSQQYWVNEVIKKQTDRLNEYFQIQISDVRIVIQKLKQEIMSKMVREERIKGLQIIIDQRINQQINNFKKIADGQQEMIKKLNTTINDNMINYGEYQHKLNLKVDTSFFQQSVNNLNSALSDQFAKIQRSFANKIQTKRALDFLQNKINRIIIQDIGTKSKRQVVINEDPCLKINRCQSHKKLDGLSQKSIKEKVAEQLSSHGFKSMNTSMWQIDPLQNNSLSFKDDKSKFKKAISNIIGYKGPVISNIVVDENKFGKSSSMPKTAANSRSDYESVKPQTPIKLKQWRDKVVRILKKEGGCRKRKVTFR